MQANTSRRRPSKVALYLSLLLVGGIAAIIIPSPPAQAASVSYFLDQSNSLADGTNYLKITIDDEGAIGAINFTVDVLPSLTPENNFGIQSFGVNGNQLSSSNLIFTGESADGWQLADNNGSMSEFGKFSNLLTTTGNHRVDSLTFSIVGITADSISDYVTQSQGNGANPSFSFFAAHVAGFRAANSTSAFFGGDTPAAVPLPAAVWLFGSGLFSLLGMASRRRRTTA